MYDGACTKLQAPPPKYKPAWLGDKMAAAMLLHLAGLLRDFLLTVVLAVCVSIAVREGGGGLARKLLAVLRQLPGVNWVIGWVLRREVRGFLRQLDPESFKAGPKVGMAIPRKGTVHSHPFVNCMQPPTYQLART